MAKVYRIKDWSKHYENNRTRDLKEMLWVPIPNAHDGEGYCQMVQGNRGAEVLGAWLACVQVASRCEPRGTLLRKSRTPHTAESLASRTRLSVTAFDEMLKRAVSEDVSWMELIEIPDVKEIPQAPAEIPQAPADPSFFPSIHSVPSKEGMQGEKFPKEIDTPAFREAWGEWMTYRRELRKPLKETTVTRQLKFLAKQGEELAVLSIHESIRNGWQGLFEPKTPAVNGTPATSNGNAFSEF